MDVDSGRRGFWWTSGFTRRVFHRDVPAVTGPVPLQEIILSSLVVVPPISPLDNSFFSNPSLLILPNLISSNTSIPFL